MTTSSEAESTRVHFLASWTVTLLGDHAATVKRGDEMLITDELRDATRDRRGHSWTDLLGDDDGQVERWGRVMFREGPFPSTEVRYEPGSVEHSDAAWAAQREAERIADATERKRALASVRETFGEDATRTSRTTGVYAAREQQ